MIGMKMSAGNANLSKCFSLFTRKESEREKAKGLLKYLSDVSFDEETEL